MIFVSPDSQQNSRVSLLGLPLSGPLDQCLYAHANVTRGARARRKVPAARDKRNSYDSKLFCEERLYWAQ